MVFFMIRSYFILSLFLLAPFALRADGCCGGSSSIATPNVAIAGCQVRDFDPLREYVNSKRSECGIEKLNNLTISGDVRTAWAHITEKYKGCQLRGSNGMIVPEANCPGSIEFNNPLDAFEITCNLYIDYVYDRAWCVSWIGFKIEPVFKEASLAAASTRKLAAVAVLVKGSACVRLILVTT